jgi:uncharacterized protein YdcH (DUF465 family)
MMVYFICHTTGESQMENTHFASLAAKHAGIDQMLHAENLRPQPDSVAISKLKKEKLRLKESMSGNSGPGG